MHKFPYYIEAAMLKIIKILIKIPSEICLLITTHFPGDLGISLRRCYWKKRLKFLGEGVRIDTGVYFQNPKFISIDENCWIDINVMILAGQDNSNREKTVLRNKNYSGEPGVVSIGKNVHIGPGSILSGISAGVHISDDCGFSAGCRIFAFAHHYKSKKDPTNTRSHFGPMASHDRQHIVEGPVWLGTNTGVALNGIVLPGVSIPENCFVTINSVVFPGRYSVNSILSGNPAKKTGDRF